jgi:1-deoxy-D-xylulose-5-phosphate reductoisomerase
MQAGMPLPKAAPQPVLAPRRVTILGATGSVGSSTVDLLRRNRQAFAVEALTAGSDVAKLARLAQELNAKLAVVAREDAYRELKEALSGTHIEAAAGRSGLKDAALRPAEWVMAAITGAAGLEPTLAAVEQGTTIALANKECLVCAGALFMRCAAAANAVILPVDSEHNAIFQALTAGPRADVKRIIVTASGGPFRTWTHEAIRAATPAQALRHPNWSMGQKITIDSATMMNKGLEIIEAKHLFDLQSHEIDVLVHPQSIIHGLVEYRDGSVIAALGSPDMRIPIAHCLAWPGRIEGPAPRLDLAKIGTLSFEAADLDRFPALAIARRALEAGQGAPTLLNAANEVAVSEFLAGRVVFPGIPLLVEAVLEAASKRGMMREPGSVDEALTIDQCGRCLAQELLPEIAAKTT